MKQGIKGLGIEAALKRSLLLLLLLTWIPPLMRGEAESWTEFASIIIFGFIILAYVTRTWVRVSRGELFKSVEEYCHRSGNPAKTMVRLEQTWNEGFETKSCQIDREYIIWVRGMRSAVISLNTASWIYVSERSLDVCDADGIVNSYSLRKGEAEELKEYLEKERPDVVICTERRQGNHIGRINARYRIIKLQERYFIADYADPRKLCNYYPFSVLFALRKNAAGNTPWRAWEIQAGDLNKIRHKKVKKSITAQKMDVVLALLTALFYFFFPYLVFYAFPIHDLVGGRTWILLLLAVGIFAGYVLYIRRCSRFDMQSYPEVVIVQKEGVITRRSHVWIFGVFYISVLAMLVMIFIFWNMGALFYAQVLGVLFVLTFTTFLYEYPKIGPGVAIESRSHETL